MKKYTRLITTLAIACSIAACGGGGGDSAGSGTAVPTWQIAQILETSDSNATEVDVSINSKGVGHAVWSEQRPLGQVALFARRYINNSWEAAVPLPGGDLNSLGVKVTTLANGEAIAIWVKGNRVLFSQTVGGVWQSSDFLQTQQGVAENLSIVANAKGDAVAAWQLRTGGANPTTQIFARLFSGSAFEPGARQVDSGTSTVNFPDVAIDAAGNAMVAWRQLDAQTNVFRVFAAANVGGFWGKAELVSDPLSALDAQGSSQSPQVVASANGVAAVVWTSVGGQDKRQQINTSTSFTNGTWDGVETITNGSSSAIRVTLDGQGTTTVVFFAPQGDGGNGQLTAARKLSTGLLFTPITSTFPANADLIDFQLGTDRQGHAIAVWAQPFTGAPKSMLASRLDPATNQWSSPELIEREDRGGVSESVTLTVSDAGHAIAAWQQQEGPLVGGVPFNSIVANVFK
jgi:hypothetical protein